MPNFGSILELMTRPTDRLIQDVKKIDGDIMVLGAGGKIGPALSIMAKRAIDAAGLKKRVVAVTLFDYSDAPSQMRDAGVEIIEADLMDHERLKALPDIPNIIFMAGKKFGTYQNQSLTWATNVLLPAKVCERFPEAKIVAFSTGNVYRYQDVTMGGAHEDDELVPVGEYAQTCVGRERVMSYYTEKNKTKMLMFRLFYAIDMRYGVLFDIAKAIHDGRQVDISGTYFSCIWQGDCCEYAIRSLLHCNNPPELLNVTGPEGISVRWAAETLGKMMGKTPVFTGTQSGKAVVFANTSKLNRLMGYPAMPLLEMMKMTADWISSGGSYINAPTHFEQTDGNY